MSDFKHPTGEEKKELDELMAYILDEMWGVDNKDMVREGIIAYTELWHRIQTKEDESLEIYANNKAAKSIKSFCESVMHPQSDLHQDAEDWINANLK